MALEIIANSDNGDDFENKIADVTTDKKATKAWREYRSECMKKSGVAAELKKMYAGKVSKSDGFVKALTKAREKLQKEAEDQLSFLETFEDKVRQYLYDNGHLQGDE